MSAETQNSMIDIIPAFPPTSFEDVEEHLGRIRGAAPLVQLDICDGQFVKNKTWPLNPADQARFAQIVKGEEGMPHWEEFNFEIDLMVQNPETHLPAWVAAGIERAVVHLESKHDWDAVAHAAGDVVELGLAIDLNPPFEKLHSYVTRVNYIQIMGIASLGISGEPLDERVYTLIEKVRSDFPDVTIQIDGGVTFDNAQALLDAGADRLAVGSQIFNEDNAVATIEELQNLA